MDDFQDDDLLDETDLDERLMYEFNDIGLALRMEDGGLISAVSLHRS